MRHSRRTILTTDDVDSALKLRNVEVSRLVIHMLQCCKIAFFHCKSYFFSLFVFFVFLLGSVNFLSNA